MCNIIIGNISWLRNDYEKDLIIGGITYPTLEHAYQAAKTKDRDIKQKIAEAKSVREARKLGRSALQSDVFDREATMTLLLRQKFSDKDLGEMLANTGSDPIVLEGYDEFWGTGGNDTDEEGENRMGCILESIRGELQFVYGVGLDKDEEDDCEECDCEDEAPTLEEAILSNPDANLAEACQDLLDGAKAVMSLVDANDFNAEYISIKTGVSIKDINEAIDKVKDLNSNIDRIDFLLESPEDESDDCEDEEEDYCEDSID